MTNNDFLNKIRQEEKDFTKAPIYLYGTEAISLYYQKLDLKNKTVLTINGSGDQFLNAYFFGAKKVVAFDLIPETKYMLDLKIAALRHLNYQQFLDFFGRKDEVGNLEYQIYLNLKPHLENDSSFFFDTLFNKYNHDGKTFMSSVHFRNRKEFYLKLDNINLFLKDETNYIKMQKISKNIKLDFITSDISNISKETEIKFDIINCSNVLNYISKDLTSKPHIENPTQVINNDILLPLKQLLTENGKIIFYKFYRASNEKHDMPFINRDESVEWLKKQNDFKLEIKEFEGILKGKDAITILENF